MAAFGTWRPMNLNQDPAPYIDKYGDRIDWKAEDAQLDARPEFTPELCDPVNSIIYQFRCHFEIMNNREWNRSKVISEARRYLGAVTLILHADHGVALPDWYDGPTEIPAEYKDTDSDTVAAFVLREVLTGGYGDQLRTPELDKPMLDHTVRFFNRYIPWVENADTVTWPRKTDGNRRDHGILYAERAFKRAAIDNPNLDKESFIAGYRFSQEQEW
ncbi:hypothetical protein ACFVAJ_17180 [Agromyces sp. NPDC057679]|uniref:hypothetical protein n=1 Tax=Agromyces sp. NPDC057679 TaxID=3346207 RepID=UPI0036735887